MNNMWAVLKNWAEKNIFYSLNNSNVGVNLSIRKRCTIAEVNAGVTLLPALPGFRYRMLDAGLIAIGGAVTAATDVRILGTRSATSVALMVAAVAGLTQSALVKQGTAAGVILADGASHTALDANTAVTVGKTGSTAATATHVDVIMSYVVEKA